MNLSAVFKVEYSHTDYDDLLKYYSRIFKTRYSNGTLELPAFYGEGHMHLLRLPNGLQCLISDYRVKQDAIFQRKKNSKNYYILRFDELSTEQDLRPSLASKSAVCLTTTNFDWLFYETRGAAIRSLNISFSEEWLNAFLGREANGDNIGKYLSLKINKFNYEPMDSEYKKLLGEVLHPDCDERFRLLYQHNRVMLLLERFFERMAQRSTEMNIPHKISAADISRIKEVAQALLKDFTAPPGITRLAKMAAMSESKLKSCFKEVYGISIYQYFQKHRMHKAKAMLVSKKYTLKEVSEEVGYENMASFGKAFQKVFDQVPSDILNETNISN